MSALAQFPHWGVGRYEDVDTAWQEEAIRFHRSNPHVMRQFEAWCAEFYAMGHRKLGIELLANQLRWESLRSTVGEYKFNQNFKAWYAREIMRRHPELGAFFETRGHA